MFCQPELEALLRDSVAESLPTRRGPARRPRSTASTQHDDHVVVERPAALGCGPLRRRLRRRQLDRARRCSASTSTTAGFFYDWLIVDVILDEPTGLRPAQRAGLRPGPPDHRGVAADPAGGAGSSCACPTRRIEDLNDEARAWELLEPWDVHPGNARLERHAVYTFQAARRPSSGRSAGCSSPATPPTRCRRSPARACARASATPPTSRGSSTSCSTGAAGAGAARHLRRGAPAERHRGHRLLDRARQGDLRRRSGRGRRPRRRHVRRRRRQRERSPRAARHHQWPASHAGSPHAGQLFPQGGRSADAWFDDVHGAGWRLVTVDAAADLDDDLVGWFAASAGRSSTSPVPPTTRPPGSHASDVRWALQRPDFTSSAPPRTPAPTRCWPTCVPTQLATCKDGTHMKIANLDGRLVARPRRRRRRRRHRQRRPLRPGPDVGLRRLGRLRRVGRRPSPTATGPLDESLLRCPVPRPRQVFAIGLNYRSHAEESGMTIPDVPATFTKFPASLGGPFDDIEIHRRLRRLGGRARRRHRHDAPTGWPRPTRGATSPDSPSARTSAIGTCSSPPACSSRWASPVAGYGPMGPWLVTPDEVPEPRRPRARLLGRRRDRAGRSHQRPRSSTCRSSSPSCRPCCRCCPATSSSPARPAGVGMARKPPRSLQPGQVLETWIEGIGTIRNRCV